MRKRVLAVVLPLLVASIVFTVSVPRFPQAQVTDYVNVAGEVHLVYANGSSSNTLPEGAFQDFYYVPSEDRFYLNGQVFPTFNLPNNNIGGNNGGGGGAQTQPTPTPKKPGGPTPLAVPTNQPTPFALPPEVKNSLFSDLFWVVVAVVGLLAVVVYAQNHHGKPAKLEELFRQ